MLGIILLGSKLFIVDRVETPLRRVASPPVAHSAMLEAGELRLIGYNLSQPAVAAGDSFDIDMAWTVLAPPAADYQSNIWLVGPDGLVWSEKETERPRLYEDAPQTRFWQPGQWAWDSREVHVLSGTPPGQYDIVLTLFDLATLQPLTLTDTSTGAMLGPEAVIGRMTVEMPAQPEPFNPQFPRQDVVPGMGLMLLGFNQDRAEALPGEQILLTLFWERQASVVAEEFALHLFNEAGQPVHAWRALPVKQTGFPMRDWQAGSGLRGQYLLRLPADLDSGLYTFALQREISLGEIIVRAPDRLFVQPEVERITNATFSDDGTPQVTLVGYTISSVSNGHLPIMLVWESLTEFSTGYHVFIHLVNDAGQIISQSDAGPAAWMRPTTSWIPGEYIVDNHHLYLPENLPDGSLNLRIGLYDPDTGERLRVETAEFVTIPLR